jgi:glycosyltransferase involved in cell wall biosynthesis
VTARLLYVHNHRSRFVEIDRALLQDFSTVVEWHQKSRRVDLPALRRAVAASDLVFGWFASWHTFFPLLLARRMGRPSVLVIGGYDTANLPEISYGHQRGGVRRWVARTTMALADVLVTNSNYARGEAIANAGARPAQVVVVHHGFAIPAHRSSHKEPLAVTMGNVNVENLHRKGILPFVQAAAYLPGVSFAVIGAYKDNAIQALIRRAAPNVSFTGWLDDSEVEDYLSRAQVYVQASRHEGFGMAVAEAMLHECVPVVTRAGALPEVVGEAGIYLESSAPEAIAEGVRCALAQPPELGRRARERIEQLFPLEKRRQGLYDVVNRALARAA